MTPSRPCKPAHLRACWRLLLVVWLACLAGTATALTLGQESILSALGDPVEVEIDVLQWDDIDLSRVQIALASTAEYESFGLSRLPVLEALDFNLVGPNTRGEVKLLVSTREPVSEPYVELLLQLRWPGGSLLREYVLLFDLPQQRAVDSRRSAAVPAADPAADPAAPADDAGSVTPPAAAEVAPAPAAAIVVAEAVPEPAPGRVSDPQPDPQPQPQPQSRPQPEPRPAAAPVVVTRAAADDAAVVAPADAAAEPAPEPRNQGAIVVDSTAPQVQTAPPASGRRVYQVREGDGLWSIAQQFQPAGAGENIYQMLLSLHDLNRAAFINGNISLLKANALLQIPDADDIAAIAADSAESLFEQRWDEGTTRLQTALRGDPLPAFSDLYASERIEDGPQAAQEAREPGEESGRLAAPQPGALLLPADTPVVVPLAEGAAGQGDLLLDEPVLQPVPQTSAAAALPQAAAAEGGQPAAAAATVNPYLERIDGSTRDLLALLQNRSLQIARLEEQLVEMRQRMRDAQQITARLNQALEQAVLRQDAGRQAAGSTTTLLGSVALVLLLALLVALVMLLKLTAQLRSQRKAWDAEAALADGPDDIPAAVARPFPLRPASHESPPADGILVEEEEGMSARDDDEDLQQELLEIIGPATRHVSDGHDHTKNGA